MSRPSKKARGHRVRRQNKPHAHLPTQAQNPDQSARSGGKPSPTASAGDAGSVTT